MSGLNLNSWTENASRLGMRLQETFSEHTKDLAISRGGSATYLDTGEDKVKNIRKQLDSNSDREKLEAMKRLIAMISKGRNVSEFFAQVVKNVAVPNLEVRKLVYIYLLRYAEAEPDLALLSINTFQRDLADSSPLIRAMALRVLSGIRVPTIGGIVVLAIKKCAADVSPLDASHLPSLIQILSTLLRDRSPLSIGSVAVAFESVCPTRLDLLHPHFRRLCRLLVDVDEWGQVDLLELLIRYARTMLPRPTLSEPKVPGDPQAEDVDPDLTLLLNSAEPLFQSRNPAVVLSVSRAFYYLALPSQHHKFVRPLLRLLDTSPQVERVVISYILSIARSSPHLFSPYYTYFIVRADDSAQVKVDKMRLLQLFVNIENYQALLREFVDYAEDVNDELVAGAIRAIGHTAKTIPESIQQCLNALMTFIKSRHGQPLFSPPSSHLARCRSRALYRHHRHQRRPRPQIPRPNATTAVAVEFRVHSDVLGIGTAHDHRAPRAARGRDPASAGPRVRAVARRQYAADEAQKGDGVGIEGIAPWAPDVLRRTTKSFCDETSLVKLQVVTLAAKLLVLCQTNRTLVLLARYVFGLARYDLNYDVRDRARMLSSLLSGIVPSLRSGGGGSDDEDALEDQGAVVLRREQIRVVLFEGKAGVTEKQDWQACAVP
ncbi:hypothetical protein EW146_g5644 [Bondarzewia mesenterica]|uniref:Clathrin/coatomer adaptor adaptin-like N-terminal domain-containing protein n=1 Tax=Bondarzewia mesenterica TaxID=1095465 RepID=A0A4S4LRG7_9AGAM|nr:hypothetical protein EW146_g5644 [Bondarzewia mesenterica]